MGRREIIAPDTSKRQPRKSLYDNDYHAWVEAQVSALERGDFAGLDLIHLADEVGDLGRSQKHKIRSNLNVVLVHLVKWKYQPDRRKPGWEVSIHEHRTRLLEDLSESPSLRVYPAEVLAKEYDLARRKAAVEMRKSLRALPQACPFTVEQVLELDFLPK
jgi:hypothetical protein